MNETVCEVVAVLPQASVAVQVLVTLNVHPLPVSAPSANVADRLDEQLSDTLAVPKAAAICAELGLHCSAEVAVTVIVGACVSRVKETV